MIALRRTVQGMVIEMDSANTRITEKYCPVVGRNVAVEQSLTGQDSACLNEYACKSERGGCTSSIFHKVWKADRQ